MKITRRIAAVLAVATISSAAAGSAGSAPRVRGCDNRLPVVAHHEGGRIVKSRRLPVVCTTQTGFATSESSIAVNNRGTIFYSPANSENTLAKSADHGTTWNLVQPAVMQYTSAWNTTDPFVTVDRRTGRIFWVHATGPTRTTPVFVDESPVPFGIGTAIAFAYGFQVYSTDDDGRRWTTADYQFHPMTDWEKLFVGPPPPTGDRPRGYPNVVYVCANSPFEVIGPGRLCYKSLDGGKTFAIAGYQFPSATAPNTCAALNTNVAVVDGNGTIYQPASCTGSSYLAVSTDESSSYEWLALPGVPGATNGPFPGGISFQLAIDAADNLYVVWITNDQLYLMSSRTHGRTWSRPMSIAGPRLKQIKFPALAAGPRGAVGVTYYAGRTTSDFSVTAYITQTTNALAARPLFVTGALNDPKHPIVHDYGLSDRPRVDFVGGAYDRDGTFWAGVVKQLGPPDAQGDIATTGLVGRLAAR